MSVSDMMTMHWSPRSPYVRKVMIAAHELGLAGRLNCVRTVVGGTTANTVLMHENPLGKLPTLVLPDGTVLYDSYVILEYFDMIGAGTKLLPVAGPERLQALRRHALGTGMLDVLLQWLGENGRPAERRSAPHVALWRGKIHAAVGALNAEAAGLAETPFGIGHLAIGVALGYLDFRFDAENWRADHAPLAAWYEGFTQRPSVIASLPVDDS